MSYYARGLALTPRYGRVSTGALIATPGYIRDQVDALNTEVMTQDREVAAQAGLPGFGGVVNPVLQAWWAGNWVPFMSAWSSFRNDHQGWTDNLWGSVLSTNNDYRQKLIDLRHSAESIGFQFTSPPPAPPDLGWVHDLGEGARQVWSLVKTVVWALILVGGAYVLFKFVVPMVRGV